jgi:hypothetical protein
MKTSSRFRPGISLNAFFRPSATSAWFPYLREIRIASDDSKCLSIEAAITLSQDPWVYISYRLGLDWGRSDTDKCLYPASRAS